MTARPAKAQDIPEVVRLAQLMYASMGQRCDATWRAAATAACTARLGRDLAVFVVDGPEPGLLAASGAGTIAARLPSPTNPAGRVGYVQWICTDPGSRFRGHARAVLRGLLEWYEQAGVPVVELHATAAGEPLYRSLGFTDVGPVAMRRRPAAGR